MKIFEQLTLAIVVGLLLVVVLTLGLHGFELRANTAAYVTGVFTWLHVVAGILWIGLLWYFNFVQIPTMPKIPADLKPAVGKFIAPAALFWFRWAALATVVTGLIVAAHKGYLVDALSLADAERTIGLGMWLGLVMAFNVWFIIWPNQQKALGIVAVDDAAKAAAARAAMLTSRFNFILSFPMLYCMVAKGTIG